jgi:hypothetical protein
LGLRIADFKPNPQSEIHNPQLKGVAISTSASSLWPARIAHSFRTSHSEPRTPKWLRSFPTPHSAFRTPHSFHPAGPRARRDCRRRCSFLRFLAIISQRRQKLWKNM